MERFLTMYLSSTMTWMARCRCWLDDAVWYERSLDDVWEFKTVLLLVLLVCSSWRLCTCTCMSVYYGGCRFILTLAHFFPINHNTYCNFLINNTDWSDGNLYDVWESKLLVQSFACCKIPCFFIPLGAIVGVPFYRVRRYVYMGVFISYARRHLSSKVTVSSPMTRRFVA